MAIMDFIFEGYTCMYKSKGEISPREEYLLKENTIDSLVPVFLYKENFQWVFSYDLQGGYCLSEIYSKEEDLINVYWFISLLEKINIDIKEFYLNKNSIYITKETILLDFNDLENMKVVYCPLYKGDFWTSILSLFGLLFRESIWFEDYLNNLNNLGSNFSIDSYILLLKNYEEKKETKEYVEEDIIEEKQLKLLDLLYSSFLKWIEKSSKGRLVIVGLLVIVVGMLVRLVV